MRCLATTKNLQDKEVEGLGEYFIPWASYWRSIFHLESVSDEQIVNNNYCNKGLIDESRFSPKKFASLKPSSIHKKKL